MKVTIGAHTGLILTLPLYTEVLSALKMTVFVNIYKNIYFKMFLYFKYMIHIIS